MNNTFKGLRVYNEDGRIFSKVDDLTLEQLSPGEVIIKGAYSSINYKDALGATGKGKIQKSFPLVAGVDVSGTVVSSQDPKIKIGSSVLVTGCGLGETHDGGFSEYIRVPASWVVPLPEGLSLREAMILGTAGFTAGLCLHRLLQNDQSPEMGPVVVTGASGGVGCFAIQLLHSMGFSVIAVSGKPDKYEFLKSLGAQEVLSLQELQLGSRPLESVRFGGAIDNLGGASLEGIVRHTQLRGNIAVVGLAQSPNFSNTVMPLILRGVSLLGVSSTNCPMDLRRKIWQHLATDWKPQQVEQIATRETTLAGLLDAFTDLLGRKIHGRIIVNLTK